MAKQIDDQEKCIVVMFDVDDKGGELVCKFFFGFFVYVFNCILEILDNFYSIDDVMKVGYVWNVGLFEYWDIIGIEKGI